MKALGTNRFCKKIRTQQVPEAKAAIFLISQVVLITGAVATYMRTCWPKGSCLFNFFLLVKYV